MFKGNNKYIIPAVLLIILSLILFSQGGARIFTGGLNVFAQNEMGENPVETPETDPDPLPDAEDVTYENNEEDDKNKVPKYITFEDLTHKLDDFLSLNEELIDEINILPEERVPEDYITRIEMAVIINKLIDMENHSKFPDKFAVPFNDLEKEMEASGAAYLVHHLELMQASEGNFNPHQEITVEETEIIFQRLGEMHSLNGIITDLEEENKQLSVATEQAVLIIPVSNETHIIRNSSHAEMEDLKDEDQLSLIIDKSGTAKYINAYGEMTSSDLLGSLNESIGEHLTPDMVKALISRDMEALKGELYPEIKTQLTELGLSENEAESIINQDWDTFNETSRERISEVLADELDINPRIITALLDRDWETLETWVQIEAINKDLLGQVDNVTDGILNPSNVAAIINNDWELLSYNITEEIVNRLEGNQIDTQEADLILNQNWDELRDYQQQKIKEAAADELGIPSEVVDAALTQNWEQLKDMGEEYILDFVLHALLEEDESSIS